MNRNFSPYIKFFLICLICKIPNLAICNNYNAFKHSEASYQIEWCNLHNGIMEYENSDYTRVDCLTETHAVEFDFAKKWAEGIGQALHYNAMTGKKGKVVLILTNPRKEMVYFRRVENLGRKYDFDVEYITNDILKTTKDGKCSNPKCICHYKGN